MQLAQDETRSGSSGLRDDSDTVGFSDADQMVVSAARLMSDEDVAFVGVGLPTLAYLLAKHTCAPRSTVIVENGIVRTSLYPLPRATDTLGVQTMADQLTGLVGVMCYAQAGFVTTGFVGAGQIDRFGNANDTAAGDYRNPTHRWPGSGGGNDVASFCKRTIYILRQSRRRFPEKVDFITCPGYLDGQPGQREELGLPPDTGPVSVITNLGIYGFEAGEMVLKSVHVHCGVTLQQVKDEVGWDLKVSADLAETSPPTQEEMRILREKVDPERIWVGGRRQTMRTEDGGV